MPQGAPNCRCWYSWREQLVDLQGDFEVAAIDLPGYNASSGPTQRAGYLSYNLCAIIAGVLRGLGRDSCTLVGHDWGAAIAYDFAALYPEKVARLMILSVPPLQCFARNMDIGQAVTSSYMQQFVLPALPEMLLRRNDYAMFRTILTKPAAGGVVNNTVTDKDVQIYKDAIATPGALTRALNYYRCVCACLGRCAPVTVQCYFLGACGVLREQVCAALSCNVNVLRCTSQLVAVQTNLQTTAHLRICRASLLDDNILRRNKDLHRRRRVPLSMPATLMVGDRDKFLHVKLFSHVGTYAPHATVHIVPNCSHWVQQDVPEKVNKALRELANA